jgi:hypothetical protein
MLPNGLISGIVVRNGKGTHTVAVAVAPPELLRRSIIMDIICGADQLIAEKARMGAENEVGHGDGVTLKVEVGQGMKKITGITGTRKVSHGGEHPRNRGSHVELMSGIVGRSQV